MFRSSLAPLEWSIIHYFLGVNETRQLAAGKTVRLEEDVDTTNRDRDGRLLCYVYLPDGRLLNAEIISQGYGHAHTSFPFSKMDEFRRLQR